MLDRKTGKQGVGKVPTYGMLAHNIRTNIIDTSKDEILQARKEELAKVRAAYSIRPTYNHVPEKDTPGPRGEGIQSAFRKYGPADSYRGKLHGQPDRNPVLGQNKR